MIIFVLFCAAVTIFKQMWPLAFVDFHDMHIAQCVLLENFHRGTLRSHRDNAPKQSVRTDVLFSYETERDL